MELQFIVTLRHDTEINVAATSFYEDITIVLCAANHTSFVIGRERSSDDDPETFVTLSSSFCSMRHARISLIESLSAPTSPMLISTSSSRKRARSHDSPQARMQVLLRDLNSTNGTLVNMVRVRESIVRSGDVVVFGGGRNLAIGDVVDVHNYDPLTKWRVLIEQLLVERAPLNSSSLSPHASSTSLEVAAAEFASWLSCRSRASLERLRESQRLPDGIVDAAIEFEDDDPMVLLPQAAETVIVKACEVGSVPSAAPLVLSSPTLIASQPITTMASVMKQATHDAAAASPSAIPHSHLATIDMQPTPLRHVPLGVAARSPSATPVPPYSGGYPDKLFYVAVQLGKVAFYPNRIEPLVNARLLSRLRRKRGPEAGWTLECSGTHVTWSMLDPSSIADSSSDGDGAPTTFSLPLSSVDWVGMHCPEVQQPQPLPPPRAPQAKKKRGKKEVEIQLEHTSNNASCSSSIVFALKPTLQIPLLSNTEAMFPPSKGGKEDAHCGLWVSFEFLNSEQLTQWSRCFELSCCKEAHLRSAVRILTEQELKAIFLGDRQS